MDKEMKALEEAKKNLESAKEKKQESLAIITGLDKKSVRIINHQFISFECQSANDMAKVLCNIEPSTNGGGDKVLIDETIIAGLIKDIKNAR